MSARTEYIAKSKKGNPVAVFDTISSAIAFREERIRRGVHADIWEVKTTERKVGE